MSSNKKYWKSVEELENGSIVEALRNNEFVEAIPTDEFLGNNDAMSSSSTSRRDFLKYVGFSTAAATLVACEGPVHKSIPYVLQPEQIIPGVADYYATSVFDGFDFANLLVKTREGRPIKVDNNTISGAKFTANARVHASILSLYDNMRLKEPKIEGKAATWAAVDTKIKTSLADAKAKGGQVVLLTNTLASPSTEKLIGEFIANNPTAKHVVYDAVSSSEALDAFETVYGERALVDYDFSKASLIVSVGADFLGDWQGGGYDTGYAQGRIPKNGKMSRHFQLEANMTLSGAAADKRVPMSVANQKQALVHIYNIVTGSSVAVSLDAKFKAEVTKAGQQLKAAGSKGVLVSGIQDKNAQLLVLAINQVLASEAFVTSGTRQIRKGSNEKVAQLIKDMNAGSVHTLIMSGVNPVYTLADSAAFVGGLKKVQTSVAFSIKEDETALVSTVAAAVPHYLESWGDLSLTKGTYSLTQPVIRPLFDTKQFQDVLMSLNGLSGTFYDYVKANSASFISGTTWNKVLHDGVFVGVSQSLSGSADYAAAAGELAKSKTSNDFELVLYTKTGMGDGQQANNPWLQEFPDPITRVSWDNYLTVSNEDAKALGLSNEIVANGGLDGSYATIAMADGVKLESVPVIVQPGQAVGTIGLALGYGRKAALKEEMQVGVNAYTLYKGFNDVQSVTLVKADGAHEFACVQGQKTLMGRGDIIKETSLEIFNTKDAKIWNKVPMVSLNHQEVEATTVDLWDSFDRSVGHHFNLSIDLNACTGCGACVIACHAENNVPVVGKSEVRRSRDMHWLRIDRYYSSESTFEGDNERKENIAGLSSSLSTFNEMEKAGDNPQVSFQPVMCQHCNHAPCETVCPVAATSHGRQGQNQMAYNRCVGTRYCANNCPYKVRRFNWFLYNKNSEFDYHMNDDLGRMVLNPDVNVRSRGVMEKCSMCIQMTQATILKAKREGRAIVDGEFQTACSNACSTGAMVFGDVNDTESQVAKLAADERSYHLLEHVGTKPNVVYHVKVRNT
ncbi:TAT-variant-translocated molybdopterin oxidoreductase [Flavobacterium granuli]|uniref:Quinol:cytochrome c oxidoreductase iron-sulfur protein n=1 Tax=Flavobacterium granuli TaxID=280093 RepID=A0A1M5MNE5_9FLAO|nr:TAT-variant-translocated molybdopterin oxidoreductase [Flavobacterium granuli]PRZ25012.1 quinol:cytochrome c oxidoreductase iron-sulfur protein precursor [Flavobacterium granuli]SHG78765.1 quinol:cytochrome c oxidoreductase iron-sulfur protein precursor [Flavobacterium granuli]